MKKLTSGRTLALYLSLGLGVSMSLLSLTLPGVIGASGPGGGRETVAGIASDALECLVVDDDLEGADGGVVHLNWSGRVERARLILSVSGAEAAHTIRVNGQSVASAPIHPHGQPCRDGEVFYIAIPPQVLAQGENIIEITNDAMPGDEWTASQVRLEVLGRFPVFPARGAAVGADLAATDVSSFTITFTNPYDGTDQEARVVLPDGYNGDPAPLVIYVHGRTSDMYEGENTLGEATRSRGWLLASPQLHGRWPYPPDPPGKYAYASLESQYDIIGTMNYMLDHYNVITDRIYLVGYSMGGQIAVVTAAKFPHVFAAIFDNKGPTDMARWYDEQWEKEWMERECHIAEVPQKPAQNPFCYQRRSGINFASNYIHVPISITHSVSDTLVPIHHSRDLRDAINGYGPDYLSTVYEDTIVGPTCGEPYHCYEPDPLAVLNFLEQFTLKNNPTNVNITTDESKSYYWLNIVQTGGDHWSRVRVACYPLTATIMAWISDTAPLTLAFNLGSAALAYERISDRLRQPGMGFPATTYLIKGGGNNYLYDYESSYLTAALSIAGNFSLTISPVRLDLSAQPDMVSGWQIATSTIRAEGRDGLGNPVPDGTAVEFSTSRGVFPNNDTVYTATVMGGQATVTLTLQPEETLVQIAARIRSVTATTSVAVIYPAIELKVLPDPETVYRGQVVTYTYRITNTGDVTLSNVTVVDNNGTVSDSSGDLTVCTGIILPTGATAECSRSTKPLTITTIVATATGRDPSGNVVVSSDSATVVVRFGVYLPYVVRSDTGLP